VIEPTRAKEEKVMDTVIEKGSEGVLVRAEPLEQAERICRAMVKVRVADDGTLLLAADLAWAQAINMVLVERGVRVSELCPIPLEEEEHLAVA
jgi:3-dehydroquinate synthase class II